jgi:hypothetical protein
MFNGVLPTFVSVMIWEELVVATATLPNERVDGERETTLPFPPSCMAIGLAASELLTPTTAGFKPFVVGVNVTDTVQLVVAASVLPQVFVSEYSPGLTPAT